MCCMTKEVQRYNANEYIDKVSSMYFNASYIKNHFDVWMADMNRLGAREVELIAKENRLSAVEDELKKYEEELFLKEKNIRTADAAMCVNINKLINKTEDILNKLKDEKEKMKLFEGAMYTGNGDNDVQVGEVSVKQKALMIVVMVILLGLLGFVLCVK